MNLDLHEVALPRTMAVKVFEPRLEHVWKTQNPGWASNKRRLRDFREKVHSYTSEGKKDPEVDSMLDRIAENRWVAVKRDPVLHKYGFQGFKPVLTDSETVSLNPPGLWRIQRR